VFVAHESEVPDPGDYVTIDVGANSVIIVRDDKTSHPAATLDLQTGGHRFGALREELLHFLALIRGEANHPLVTIDDAVKVIALAEMLMRSAQHGTPVTVAEYSQ
jgi:predicted dehydrogenase